MEHDIAGFNRTAFFSPELMAVERKWFSTDSSPCKIELTAFRLQDKVRHLKALLVSKYVGFSRPDCFRVCSAAFISRR